MESTVQYITYQQTEHVGETPFVFLIEESIPLTIYAEVNQFQFI